MVLRILLPKLLLIFAICLAMTLLDTIVIFIMRTKGPLPFKFKIQPDFDLPGLGG